MNPKELQFTDRGHQNVRDFGHYQVVMMDDGKTALKSPGTGAIMPRNMPAGGEEIMRQNKMNQADE